MTYFCAVGNAAEPLGAILWAAAPLPAKARDTLGLTRSCAMQPFEYRSVRYWSKEINGTLPGGRKILIF